jgi:hypothetical protein
MTEHLASTLVPADSASGSGPPSAPRPMLALLAALSIVLITYAGVLGSPLLWDDLPLLEQSAVATLHSPQQYLLVPFWDTGQAGNVDVFFYRPLTTLSLALDGAVHGRNPAGFHLTNLWLHLVNVSLVFFLARKMSASVLAAGAGALTWGVLPRLAECVSWVSGRTDELGALGVLSALLVWRRGSLRRTVLASALASLGMLGKEMAVAAPLALAVGELWPRPARRAWLRALVPITALATYIGLRTALLGRVTGPALPLSFGQRIPTMLESVGRYVWMTLDVWHPATQIGVIGGSGTRFVVLGVLALLGATVLVWRYARRVDAAWAALSVAGVIPVLLVIHIVPLPWLVVAGDRLMYLPWAILTVAAAVGCSRSEFCARYRHGVAALVFGLVASLALTTRARVAIFADEVDFWVDAVETTPAANWGPTLCLNELYVRAGLYRESLAILASFNGRQRQPVPIDLRAHWARALGRIGEFDEAYRIRRSIEGGRRTPQQMVDEATAALHVFELAQATELTERARRALPQFERADRLRKTIVKLTELRRLLREAPPPGLDGDIARARLETLAGRGLEAESAWCALLARPELPASVAEEGLAFVTEVGSRDALKQALSAYAARGDAREELVLGARDRLAFSDRLASRWPRVVRALERLRGSSLSGRLAASTRQPDTR